MSLSTWTLLSIQDKEKTSKLLFDIINLIIPFIHHQDNCKLLCRTWKTQSNVIFSLSYEFHVVFNALLNAADKQEDNYSNLIGTRAEVPQGSVFGPVLYLLSINDIPKQQKTSIATFTADTSLLTSSTNADTAMENICHFQLDK